MTETKTLFNGKYLRIKCRGSWEYAERANPGGAVIVLAITTDDEVVFVEQYRVPIECKTIELPAGLVGDLDEHAHEGVIETAQRELEEEAGYRAEKITYIMAGPSSAGMSNEVCAFVRATGLTRVGAGGGVHGEDIVVHHVPRRDVAPWLAAKMRAGYSIDPKLYAGLYFLDRDLEGRPWESA
jgi:ADP-ribose pyrophosphatase